jgi:pantoate--beta-alanine ligase
MLEANTISNLRRTLRAWRQEGERIHFVPTMGNLHAGHLRLVDEARKSKAKVVVSIFVNPTQFGPGEDFEAYPRTELEDRAKLTKAGADLLFLPPIPEIYSPEAKTLISVKELSSLHCGAFRPGHFDGVATIVCKLFNLVQPDEAFFGQKDYQQLTIIKTMVRDLNIPVTINAVETVRETSGLAMSSRNNYLTRQEQANASMLYKTLCRAREAVETGLETYKQIEDNAMAELKKFGFQPEYFHICRADDLLKASKQDTILVILAAAKLGKTRLIDNVAVNLGKS